MPKRHEPKTDHARPSRERVVTDVHDSDQKTAVLYLRVSTKEQAERDGDPEGYSIPAQREACRRKATSLDAIVTDEFADKGESARKADRPQLQALLAYIRAHHVDFVIVHKIDRLARNRADDVEITLAIRSAGAKLVSCSENIDETPSGVLLHAIMSGVAEFYSRNLAHEVIKGSVQKARSGGTIGKAPLGYRNVRKLQNGREVRTVEIDPIRGPLMKWALETYATGAWSVRRLCNELDKRGLDTTPGPVRPSKPIYQSLLHMRLRDPYYKGVVRYRGVEYPGSHEPLITPEVWQQVQDVLSAQNHAGEQQKKHLHYLKGSLFCGNCGSRLLVTNARSRRGVIYPYFVCSGRHGKYTDCTFRAVLIESIERKVENLHADYRIEPEFATALERTLIVEFEAIRQDADKERETLSRRQQRLLDEREKLLQAHYAEAIPLDLLRDEQERIRAVLGQIHERLGSTEHAYGLIERNLTLALGFLEDNHAEYLKARPQLRRQINQALFRKIYVDQYGEVRGELAEPFETLLSRPIRHLAAVQSPQVDWAKWEASFNEPEAPEEAPGLNPTNLVGGTGLEPVTPSLSSWCSPN
jgi:site-specific DNA recombinase